MGRFDSKYPHKLTQDHRVQAEWHPDQDGATEATYRYATEKGEASGVFRKHSRETRARVPGQAEVRTGEVPVQ